MSNRIQLGQSVRWRTYPDAKAGPEHEGVVVAFVPAGQSLTSVLAAVDPEGWRLIRNNPPPFATRDRYLVRCEDRDLRRIYRSPSAALIERQNPNAKREPPHEQRTPRSPLLRRRIPLDVVSPRILDQHRGTALRHGQHAPCPHASLLGVPRVLGNGRAAQDGLRHGKGHPMSNQSPRSTRPLAEEIEEVLRLEATAQRAREVFIRDRGHAAEEAAFKAEIAAADYRRTACPRFARALQRLTGPQMREHLERELWSRFFLTVPHPTQAALVNAIAALIKRIAEEESHG